MQVARAHVRMHPLLTSPTRMFFRGYKNGTDPTSGQIVSSRGAEYDRLADMLLALRTGRSPAEISEFLKVPRSTTNRSVCENSKVAIISMIKKK